MSYLLLVVDVFAHTSRCPWTACSACALSLGSAWCYYVFLFCYRLNCLVSLEAFLLQLLQIPHKLLLIKFLNSLKFLKLIQYFLFFFLAASSLLSCRCVHAGVMRIEQPLPNAYKGFFSLGRSVNLFWLRSRRSWPLPILSCAISGLDNVIQGLYLKSTLLKFRL